MKRLILLVSLALVCGVACKKEKAPLLNQPENNNNGDNNSNGENNTVGPNNTTGDNNTNNQPPLQIIEADPSRNYTGTVTTFAGSGAVAEFIHDVNLAECEALFECVDNASVLFLISSLRVATVGDCARAFNARRPPSVAQDAADAGLTTFDATMADSCLSEITSASCPMLPFSTGNSLALHDSCKSALTGAGDGGTDCDGTWECGEDLYCGRFATDCLGLCNSISSLQRTCNETTCDFDQRCSFEDSTCGPLGDVSASCFSSTECAGGLSCAGGECRELTLVDEGSSCDAEYLCRPGTVCNGSNCVLLGTVGDSCEHATECDWSAQCQGGSCADSRGAVACQRDNECGSANCYNSTCVAAGGTCYDL